MVMESFNGAAIAPFLETLYMLMLVGGLEHFLFFHSVGDVIIPIDELIFFRGVAQPPTSYSLIIHRLSIDIHRLSIDYP